MPRITSGMDRPAAKRLVVSIFGGAGSGKSTLAKALVQAIGEAHSTRIPVDYYLVPDPFGSMEAFRRRPLCYDWALIERVLQGAEGARCTTPDFDFTCFQRVARRGSSRTGGRAFVLRRLVFLDGMQPYPKADFAFRLDCPAAERRRRVAARDLLWGTQAAQNWDLFEITLDAVMRLQYPVNGVLSGEDSLDVNVKKVRETLEGMEGKQ